MLWRKLRKKHAFFFPRLDLKEVMHHQWLNNKYINHSEEIWRRPISKSIKDRGQCTKSNKINDNFRTNCQVKTLCRSYRPLQHVGKIGLNLTYCENTFLLNPSYQKVYITHNKAMSIVNLVDTFLCDWVWSLLSIFM